MVSTVRNPRVVTPEADHGGPIQAVGLGTVQVVAYTGTAGVSENTIGSSLVRVVSTTACHIAFGASPTATTSDAYLPADIPEYFRCARTDKISAIQVSSGGNLNVTAATEDL